MRGKKGNKEVLKRILLCIRPYTSLVVLSLGSGGHHSGPDSLCTDSYGKCGGLYRWKRQCGFRNAWETDCF